MGKSLFVVCINARVREREKNQDWASNFLSHLMSIFFGQLVAVLVLGLINPKNNIATVQVVFAYFWPNLSRSTFGLACL
jgi:hypothetical protein